MIGNIIQDRLKQPFQTILFIAQGLNIYQLISSMTFKLKQNDLVLLLGFNQDQLIQINRMIGLLQKLENIQHNRCFIKLNKKNKQQRSNHYSKGGLYFLSEQILIFDLLSKNILHPLMIHLIIAKIHKEITSHFHKLAWIMTQIRIKNENVNNLVIVNDFQNFKQQNVERMMRNLYIKNIEIWPFGRNQVIRKIKSCKTFNQFEVKMKMEQIDKHLQNTLIQMYKIAVKDLDPNLNWENIIKKQYRLKTLSKQMNNSKKALITFQILNDIKKLMNYTINVGPIRLYKTFQKFYYFINMQYQNWFMLSETKKLIKKMQDLIFNKNFRILKTSQYQIKLNKIYKKILDQQNWQSTIKCNNQLKIQNIQNQKISKLSQIISNLQSKFDMILIICNNQQQQMEIRQKLFGKNPYHYKMNSLRNILNSHQSSQIRKTYLQDMKRFYLKDKVISNDIAYNVLLQQLASQLQFIFNRIELFLVKNLELKQENFTYKQIFKQSQIQSLKYVQVQQIDINNIFNLHIQNQKQLYKDNIRIVSNASYPLLSNILSTLKPQIVFIYQPKLEILRQLYIFQGQAFIDLKEVYVLIFQKSIESTIFINGPIFQQNFFWNLSQKKKNLPKFEMTAKSRKNILDLDENKDRIGKGDQFFKNLQNIQKLTVINPQLIGRLSNIQRKYYYIIVDKRQFKSELPSILYHTGFYVVPAFLQIGDYILSKNICIERKSVQTKDIIQSIKSGRLEQQMKKMSKKYERCYLLIQFSENLQFESFQIDIMYKNGIKVKQKTTIFILRLLLKYPGVKILWSKNMQQTVELFKYLKRGTQQPNLKQYLQKQVQQDYLMQLQDQNSQI